MQPILIEEAYADERFNRDVDKETGYETHSILTCAIVDENGECNGVIQALNKQDTLSFDLEDQELLLALGGQAAVAVDNAKLHGEIELLLEGFIKASVYAIEARDPTTSGHSGRGGSNHWAAERSTDKHLPISRGSFSIKNSCESYVMRRFCTISVKLAFVSQFSLRRKNYTLTNEV